jgi:hypothetical protein
MAHRITFKASLANVAIIACSAARAGATSRRSLSFGNRAGADA